MQQAYALTGTVADAQTLRLDEALPVGQGKVRVVVELLPDQTGPALREVLARIHEGQRARRAVPPTREEVDAYLKAEREGWYEE
jgi:hypothetical protein